MNVDLKMMLAGALFGAWPLVMSKSGLPGVTSTVILSFVILLFVLPVGLYSGLYVKDSKWWFAIAAGILGAFGLLLFNAGLAESRPENVGRLFVVMIVIQTAIPAIYHAIANGGLDARTTCGFIAAAIAAFLLI